MKIKTMIAIVSFQVSKQIQILTGNKILEDQQFT